MVWGGWFGLLNGSFSFLSIGCHRYKLIVGSEWVLLVFSSDRGLLMRMGFACFFVITSTRVLFVLTGHPLHLPNIRAIRGEES